jgi:hypothetical protein
MNGQPSLARHFESFFRERLTQQRNATQATIAAYRDALRLLVIFASERTGKKPSALVVEDLDRDMILAYLDHLERSRGNCVHTRNARLTGLAHSSVMCRLVIPLRLASLSAYFRFQSRSRTCPTPDICREPSSTHSSMRRMCPHKSAVATVSCCCSLPVPVPESQRRSAWTHPTSRWTERDRMSCFAAKVASNV